MQIIHFLLNIIDFFITPFVFLSVFLLKMIRKFNVKRNFPLAHKIFIQLGIFPIRDHYYDPLFNPKHLSKPLETPRNLSAIDFNIEGQLDLLRHFQYSEEILELTEKKDFFDFNNNSFNHLDADMWYNYIRHFKPKRIIEIGSGNSTKLATLAIAKNKEKDASYQCEHICIEPYEMPWLESLNIKVYRDKVEAFPLDFFMQLEANDILFIDSSHVLRPQGDVLFEFLEILPVLKQGVIVHIHDIFSPQDYPHQWVVDDNRLWNEQYLLEAFLSYNNQWQITSALNLLRLNHRENLVKSCPNALSGAFCGSFYIQRI
jgi:hypothetical protein